MDLPPPLAEQAGTDGEASVGHTRLTAPGLRCHLCGHMLTFHTESKSVVICMVTIKEEEKSVVTCIMKTKKFKGVVICKFTIYKEG